MCSVLHLHTFSRGVGAARRLFISRQKVEKLDAGGKWQRPDAELQVRWATSRHLLCPRARRRGSLSTSNLAVASCMIIVGSQVQRFVTAWLCSTRQLCLVNRGVSCNTGVATGTRTRAARIDHRGAGRSL